MKKSIPFEQGAEAARRGYERVSPYTRNKAEGEWVSGFDSVETVKSPMMETVKTVAADVRARMEKLTIYQLCDILEGYGYTISGLTRTEMIGMIVDFEVYAFTH